MKKNKKYLKVIVLGIILIPMVGCSSKDDSSQSEPDKERIVIAMEPPFNNDINWKDVKLVWNEEFGELTKIEDIWIYETNPNRTNEMQIYREENVEVYGGTLKIHAKEEAGVYTSARLSSKYAYKYGRIEIGAKFPEEGIKGIWAKISLLGDNINLIGYPHAGEIDIADYFSNSPNKIHNYIHSSTNNSDNGTLISSNKTLETAEEEFHAYGMLWTDEYIKFYIDNPENITYSFLRPSSPTEENWPFDKPFFLITGMVIGGEYGGEGVDPSLFPATMEIDYIRVYHPN